MLGMEKMIASLIGMEPEQMQAKIKEVETVFSSLAEALQSLAETSKKNEVKLDFICEKVLTADQKAKLVETLATLERENNERSNNDN